MASWIGASDKQRFYQYTLPAAKKAVASNYKEKCRKPIAEKVAVLRSQHALASSDFERKKINRRIRDQLNEWQRVCHAWDIDQETLQRANK